MRKHPQHSYAYIVIGKALSKQGYIITILITRNYIEAIAKQVFSKGESYPE